MVFAILRQSDVPSYQNLCYVHNIAPPYFVYRKRDGSAIVDVDKADLKCMKDQITFVKSSPSTFRSRKKSGTHNLSGKVTVNRSVRVVNLQSKEFEDQILLRSLSRRSGDRN